MVDADQSNAAIRPRMRFLATCLSVGAGVELTGPGGDGFLSVLTPASPVGKAVLGRRVRDTIEVMVQAVPLEWAITFVG